MSQGLGVGPPSNDQKRNFSPQNPRTLPPIHDDRLKSVSRNAAYTPAPSQNASTGRPSETMDGRTSTRPAGPLGMQNLLNPSGQNVPTDTGRRRSADHFDLPPTTGASTPQLPSPHLSQSPSNNALTSMTPPANGSYPSLVGQPPRQMSTPRTPSLYSAPANTMGLPSGTIDATKSPFVGSRDQASAIGALSHNLPMMPSGPPLQDSSYNGPPSFSHSPSEPRPSIGASQLQNIHERRPSAGGLSSQPPASQSNSPSTSYSSYSRFSRTPPAPHTVVAASQPSSFFAPNHDKVSRGSSGPPNYESKESFGPVTSSMGHGTLQLMTLDTEQGPIQVPVDVTAASKVADEKRKRNATASHRFRQRRKEKERETSQNIAKLEHQIRELAEERDYYRLERDYFRNFAAGDPGQARFPPRPPSPRQVRLAQLNGENGVPRDGQWQPQDEHSSHGRNTRRRTSAYTPATGTVLPVNTASLQLPRYGTTTASPSDHPDRRPAPGIRTTLPGPLVMRNGPFDASGHVNYTRG